jgi:hypothetical protein
MFLYIRPSKAVFGLTFCLFGVSSHLHVVSCLESRSSFLFLLSFWRKKHEQHEARPPPSTSVYYYRPTYWSTNRYCLKAPTPFPSPFFSFFLFFSFSFISNWRLHHHPNEIAILRR